MRPHVGAASNGLGSPDDMKFRSSMALFGRADPAAAEFGFALAWYFDGREDERTLVQLTAEQTQQDRKITKHLLQKYDSTETQAI